MAYNVPSRYQPIWNLLKQKHHAELVAPVELHHRIFEAVRKRKKLDLAYKLLLGESHKKAELSRKSDGTKLIITLKFYPYFNSTGAY